MNLEIDGIGGLQYGYSFQSDYVPETYKTSTVFQMGMIEHRISAESWTTKFEGLMRMLPIKDYKVKADNDQTDFDDKNYVLMNQETDSSIVSGSEQDIKEFIFKTADEKITYSSDNVVYDKFKTFSVKMVLTSNNAVTVPKVRDMRVIALDT